MKKLIPVVFGVLVGVGMFLAGVVLGQKTGTQEGLDFFFEACYTSSCVYAQRSTERAIVCAPVQLPVEAPAQGGLTHS